MPRILDETASAANSGRVAGKIVMLTAVIGLMTACGATQNPRGFFEDVANWQVEGNLSNLALAALQRGQYDEAERLALQAIKSDPADPFALLAAGLVHQNTARPAEAKQFYRGILALEPINMITIPAGDGQLATQRLTDVARANIAAIDRALVDAQRMQARNEAVLMAEDAAAQRFRILDRLLDAGLITRTERQARRDSNIGALLPFSAPPPAVGLDRPVPAPEQVVERLRALARSLERGAITPGQHEVERGFIIDALLPASAQRLSNPPEVPRDMLEAARLRGRLERLFEDGLISKAEFDREKAALSKLDAQIGTAPAAVPVLAQVPKAAVPVPPAAPRPAAAPANPAAAVAAPVQNPESAEAIAAESVPIGGPASLHLASLRSERQARREWDVLKSKFEDLLGDLQPTVVKIDLGAGKGTFYRLKAGTVPSDQAQQLCRSLLERRQFCEVETAQN